MARKLDKILVIDIESTCWEGDPPPGQESEIIEIGICELEVATGNRLSKRGILVKPDRSQVSEFCTKLTTLTKEQVSAGIAFDKACKILKQEYDSKNCVWASYGDYDRRQFERQCQREGIGYPFGPTHLNVKSLFALASGSKREVGMAGALKQLKIPLEGTHHRGEDDAWNIASVLSRVLMSARGGLDSADFA